MYKRQVEPVGTVKADAARVDGRPLRLGDIRRAGGEVLSTGRGVGDERIGALSAVQHLPDQREREVGLLRKDPVGGDGNHRDTGLGLQRIRGLTVVGGEDDVRL